MEVQSLTWSVTGVASPLDSRGREERRPRNRGTILSKECSLQSCNYQSTSIFYFDPRRAINLSRGYPKYSRENQRWRESRKKVTSSFVLLHFFHSAFFLFVFYLQGHPHPLHTSKISSSARVLSCIFTPVSVVESHV